MLKIISLFLSFLLGFFITKSLIPKLKIISIKNNILDNPDERKTHLKSISILGGIGIYLGSFLSIASLIFIFSKFFSISFEQNDLLIFILGPFLFSLLGFFDDLYNLKYTIRLAIQFFFSSLIFILLLKVNFYIDLSWFVGDLIVYLPTIFSFFVAVIWISGMVNAVNWFDGIDGLASSSSIFFAVGLICLAATSNSIIVLFFLTSLIGSNLGFLKYNWHPASIFMGDSGSNFLGFSLAIASLHILKDASNEISLNVLLLFFLIPILDMILVILNRIRNKRSPFLPDNSHLHHRLVMRGFSVTKTVLTINLLTQFFIFLSLMLQIDNNYLLLIPLSLLILNFIFFIREKINYSS